MKRRLTYLSLFALLLPFLACQQSTKQKESTTTSDSNTVTLDSVAFGANIDGKAAKLYQIKNSNGVTAYLTEFGARIVGLWVPDRLGTLTDVVLGFKNAADYNNPAEPYFGPIVGPFGNRIANGKFSLDGKSYTTTVNNGPNTLHGGEKGLHFVHWTAKQVNDKVVSFTYTHPDMQDGFPGNIKIEVIYSLTDDNELHINYQAVSDKKTVINLTNHAYFNLNGEGSGSILNHDLRIFAEQYTPVDSTLIPTGELANVNGTPFDFNFPKTIGKDIDQDNQQLAYGKGYDHNFVLNGTKVDGLNHAATLTGDQTGIIMDIYTQEPGLQFYSGNFMGDKVTLKSGKTDSFRTAVCLEPQHFPDSPNQANFPSTILNPGDTYSTKSIYKFSTIK